MKVEIAFFYAISTFIDWFLVKKMYLCNEKNDNNSYCMKQYNLGFYFRRKHLQSC